MNKTQLAQAIVEKESAENPYTCGCKGIAMEVLGLLTPEEQEYVSGRGGAGFIRYKNLFPEEIRNRIAEFTSLRDVFLVMPD